jgi:hypothetical protein
MNNQIQQIKNCLPIELADTTHAHIKSNGWKYGWRSNTKMGFPHWNQDFGKATLENGLDISSKIPEPLSTVWNHLRVQYFSDVILLRCYANGHTFGVEGYPHCDSERDGDRTMVIYMNKVWRREWGGETVVYNEDGIAHAESPSYNTGLVLPGNQMHVAKSVSRVCPDLRMTLMFKFCTPGLDPLRDQIQIFLEKIGANKIAHSNGFLMGHLLRVYDLLKQQKYSDTVCAAGGLHSIFGTNAFQHQTLSKSERDRVVEIIGEEATKLVDLFSSLNRPQALESALSKNHTVLRLSSGTEVTVTRDQLNSLCAIEAANLHDQNGLNSYQNIKRFLLI